MPIPVECPTCLTRLRAPDAAAGVELRCPTCGGAVAVPAGPEPDIEVVEPDPQESGRSDRRRSRTRAGRSTAGRRVLPLVLVGLGAVVVVAGAAGGLVLAFRNPNAGPGVAGARLPPAAPPAVRPPALPPAPEQEDPFAPAEPDDAATLRWLDERAAEQPEPIPQDAARAASRRAARRAWYRDSLVGGFDRSKGAQAPWAGKAREALQFRADEFAAREPSGLDYRVKLSSDDALAAAIAAGCDDPLVLYLRHRLDHAAYRFPLLGQAAATLVPIVEALWASEYGGVRKAHAIQNLLTLQLPGDRDPPPPESRVWDARYWEALGRACRDPDPYTQADVVELARVREEYVMAGGGTREKAHAETAARLAEAGAPAYTRLVVTGSFLIRHAWDARGRGLADTVTPEGHRLLRRRMAEAEAALAEAHDLDPDRPEAATQMLWVCVGLGHPREEMERWFGRAMRAEPDNTPACTVKIEYLHPKWYGTDDDYLGFAWQCVRTRNVHGRLPVVPVAHVMAHHTLPRPIVFPTQLADLRAAYGRPNVWVLTRTALTVLTRADPELSKFRGLFARLACVAGRYDVARRELAGVADAAAGGFLTPRELEYYRSWAAAGILPDAADGW
ncbi:hypothetical protein [Urbifossiella limnaea]|uniref:DUF4034 domain-containing protein n=1 Tax=Urbifossiella limnaea TaxID=2528023 RepID=A0A517XUU1_9BACT|nr:hypothetical protein [Urbifossiella limnaea]QDU21280.1 hypothetical protein ETAA1_32460 [Urbifossiella limnaea]